MINKALNRVSKIKVLIFHIFYLTNAKGKVQTNDTQNIITAAKLCIALLKENQKKYLNVLHITPYI